MHTTSGWVIDKRISLPHLCILLSWIAGSIWYMAKFDSRMTENENKVFAADMKAQKALDAQVDIGQRMVRIETLLESTNQSIARIEKKLDK